MQSTLCDLTRNLFGSSKLEIEISVEKCIPEIAAVAKQRAVYRLVISIQIPLFVWRRQKMSTYMRTFKSNLYSRDTACASRYRFQLYPEHSSIFYIHDVLRIPFFFGHMFIKRKYSCSIFWVHTFYRRETISILICYLADKKKSCV